VGTVITDPRLENVVAIGYNGNVRGFPNDCDAPTPGACGCIHSEMNALVKAPGSLQDKVVFVTASPCVMCAKLMVQARVRHLFYREPYRSLEGLEVLRRAGVVTVQYDRWRESWRGVRESSQ
jgi:dCMP deaminase